jgi:GT2 family glycosyltransferase
MISFVIPVKNDAAHLQRCLRSMARNEGAAEAVEIIVVDNGSTDESVAVARAAGAKVVVLAEGRVARLRNEGASMARGDLLAFVDADHEIGAGWVAAALDDMRSPDVGATGALYITPTDTTWAQRMYGALRGRTVGRSDARWLGSGNLVVRRVAFEALDGFDKTLESCEDVDFCERLRAAGWRLIADERLVSVHHGDPATLRKLFRAERWRGRDNLAVTFRHGLTLRDVPSVLSPILIVICTVISVAAAFAIPFAGSFAVVALTATLGAIAGLCVLRGLRVAGSARARTVATVAQALAVGATYELARAAAIVSRASHHRDQAAYPHAARAPMR